MRRARALKSWAGQIGLLVVVGAIAAHAADGPASPSLPASPAPTDGARLYARECAPCHGATGAGDGPDAVLFAPPPPDLRPFVQHHDREDLARRILDGASAMLAPDASALRRRADTGEALVSHLLRLGNVDWPVAERGRSLYAERCERCHGPFGRPPAAVAPGGEAPRTLSDPRFQAAVDDRALESAVRHGRPGMPRLAADVSPADAQALVAYVRLLSPGYEAYERYCAGCHGEEGVPSAGARGGRHPPPLKFDRGYAAMHGAQDVRAKVWHMLGDPTPEMPHFRGELSEADAAAIASFLTAR